MGRHFLEDTIEELESQIKPKKIMLLKSIIPKSKKNVFVKDLSEYFNDPHCQIFFRKPKGLTSDIAKKIVEKAEEQKGCKYDLDLIEHMVEVHSIVGWTINKLTRGGYENRITLAHEGDDKWICSELAAHCLDEQPEYKDKGILSKLDATIDPQELFEDQTIFEPWKKA
jgi:hypothetical protein